MGVPVRSRVAWVWSWPGALAVAVGLVQAGLAALVFGLRPDRAANRALALMLFFEGAALAAGAGLVALTDDPLNVGASRALATLLFLLVPLVEVWFLSTLDAPLTRPLRSGAARVALVVVGAALCVAFYVARPLFLVEGDSWEESLGPAQLAYSGLAALLHLYALAAAVSAWRRAQAPLARRQAFWFAASFGARNVGFVIIVALVLAGVPGVTTLAFQLLALAYVPLLAYGLVSAQLFDVELRIKVGIQRGTIVAVFLVIFVGVAEVAQNYASNEYGYLAGGIAAGALLLAIHPLQRMAERVGDAALPKVAASPEYLAYRKFEVYRAALEGALEDGEVTPREREVLRRLRASLGITDGDAAAMERDLQGATPSP